MNLFQIIFIALGGIALYEFFGKPYFQKRKIARMEKETMEWAKLIRDDGVVNAEREQKSVQSFLKTYHNTKFNDDQADLRIEVIKLLYLYVNTTLRILTQHGIQMTSFSREDSEGTIDKLTMLEKRQHHLENILKNLFEYLKDTNEEENE
jgi:hypothetical protein